MPKNQIDHRSIVYREQARSILDSAILDIAPNPEARKLQVSWMADRCLVQMINYVRLSKVLKGTKPCFITTEHDTGTVGPLFSIAERLGSQIIVIPHSSYPTQPLPHAINVTAIERDGFLSPIRSVWGAKVKTRQVRLTPKILGPVRPKVRTVCLLLNTLYSRGISYIDLRGLMDFYRDLDELCTSSDVKLFVRMKPGGSCPAVIAGTLGIPISELNEIVKTDLGELAFGSDICINYGELSSGIIDFLEYNSYVLHTSEEMRPSDLLNTSNLSTMTSLLSMPRREIMGVIKKTLCESTYYAAQLQEQQREFLSRCIKSTDRIFED